MNSVQKAKWLKEHAKEIVEYVRMYGREAALECYNIRSYVTLVNLLKSETGNPYFGCTIPYPDNVPYPSSEAEESRPGTEAEVVSLIGGPKAKWLRERQSDVVFYWWKQGTIATLVQFRITQKHTLQRLLGRAGIEVWEGWEDYQGLRALGQAKTPEVHHAETASEDLARLDEKQLCLEEYKVDVVRFFEDHSHSIAKTCHKFNLSGLKLTRLLKDAYRSLGVPLPKFDDEVTVLRDAVILQSAAVAELRREVRELKEAYNDFEHKVTEGLQQVVGQFLQRLAVQQTARPPALPGAQQPQLPEPKAQLPAGRCRCRNPKRQSRPKSCHAFDVVEEAKAIAAQNWVDEEEQFHRLALEDFKDSDAEYVATLDRKDLIHRGRRECEYRRLTAQWEDAVWRQDWMRAHHLLLLQRLLPWFSDKDVDKQWEWWEQQAEDLMGENWKRQA